MFSNRATDGAAFNMFGNAHPARSRMDLLLSYVLGDGKRCLQSFRLPGETLFDCVITYNVDLHGVGDWIATANRLGDSVQIMVAAILSIKTFCLNARVLDE